MTNELIRLKNSILQTTEAMKADKNCNKGTLKDLLIVVAKLELEIAKQELDAGWTMDAAINAQSALSVLEDIIKLAGNKK